MPPRKESDPPQTHLTNREIELLSTALHCTKTPLQIDYRLLSAHAAFKTPTSAKSSWCALKRKLDRIVLDGGAAVSSKECRHRPSCSKEDVEFCVNGVVPELRIEGAQAGGSKKGTERAKKRKVAHEDEDFVITEQDQPHGGEDEDDEEEAIPEALLWSDGTGVKTEQEASRPESVRASSKSKALAPTRMPDADEDDGEEALPLSYLGSYGAAVKREQVGGLRPGLVSDSRKNAAWRPGRVVDEDLDDEEEEIVVSGLARYGRGVKEEDEGRS